MTIDFYIFLIHFFNILFFIMTNKQILNFIISEKGQGNTFQEMHTKMKIMFKGINVKGILEGDIPDDPALNLQLINIGAEFELNMAKLMI